ncbi:MAG: glutathione S-transferase family protein [Gammaproteobacteria bacterium]|nr:glutathione S-transferase family protein [Gammaproteobacteria bacterium]
MPNELTLYTNPMSRGRIARWMLEETGASYDVEVLTFDDSIRSAAYRAVNPMAKVPAIRHGDVVVTEAAAICAYLADAFPDAGLAPPVRSRGTYYRWLFFGAGPFEAATVNKMIGVEVTPEQQGMVGYGTLERVLDALEGVLEANTYVAGEAFSAADVYVGANLNWGVNMMRTIEGRPAFARYLGLLGERPALTRANALDDALAATLG